MIILGTNPVVVTVLGVVRFTIREAVVRVTTVVVTTVRAVDQRFTVAACSVGVAQHGRRRCTPDREQDDQQHQYRDAYRSHHETA